MTNTYFDGDGKYSGMLEQGEPWEKVCQQMMKDQTTLGVLDAERAGITLSQMAPTYRHLVNRDARQHIKDAARVTLIRKGK